ncbi:MAG: YifB family Mg chelatase-like AAA ATPase [Planctomycetota bacterium]|nr:YifB family Mg chelatase-like AAA ATPase [Planctomycetota bacterium]
MLAKCFSAAAQGVEAAPVEVEVDVAPGMATQQIVGLPDAAVKESLHRVRSALAHTGFSWPANKRVTVNLAPADTRKEGPLYDLPIALGLMAAAGQLEPARLGAFLMVGELALDGRLRPVRGVLLYALLARAEGRKGILCPPENAEEAAVVEGLEVYAPATLGEAVGFLCGNLRLEPVRVDLDALFAHEDGEALLDLADVKGQEAAKRALTVAAAGGHNILMIGPPGSGKSMLAKRVPTILPPLTLPEALETTKIWSVAGKLRPHEPLVRRRPVRDPHHTLSYPALVGGGIDPKPGEISLAHHGVLFLDELPEFDRKALEAMRQPLEDRVITVSRVSGRARFPANIMLVAAMNPCPCGHYGDPKRACRCSEMQIQRYFGRVSGPVMDRIDLHVEVPHVPYEDLSSERAGPSSAEVRGTVLAARKLQQARLAGSEAHCNAALSEKQVQSFCKPDKEGSALLKNAVDALGFSARAYARILKVARTIADLEGAEQLGAAHVSEALQYRSLDREKKE